MAQAPFIGRDQEARRRATLQEHLAARARDRFGDGATGPFEAFLDAYHVAVPLTELDDRDLPDLYGAALAHWQFGQGRMADESRVRVYSPTHEDAGWQCRHSVVEVVAEDLPFLVDSITAALGVDGLGIHFSNHVTLRVARDGDGDVVSCGSSRDEDAEGVSELYLHIEIDRVTDSERLCEIASNLESVLAEVRLAVDDWQAMRGRATAGAELLPEGSEERALVEWLEDRHFVLIGAIDFDETSSETLEPVPDTALGVLRTERRLAAVEAVPLGGAYPALYMTKSRDRSVVARPVWFDEIWIERAATATRPAGRMLLLGLFGADVYNTSAQRIPVLRQKIVEVLERAPFQTGSHGYQALRSALERYPRDELFQMGVAELTAAGLSILSVGERSGVRLFVREDDRGRFHSCLAYVPRQHYATEKRLRIEDVLVEAFAPDQVEFTVEISDAPVARVHFLLHHATPVETPDVAMLEERLRRATRDWADRLRDDLIEAEGEERGVQLHSRYVGAFERSYQDGYTTRTAVSDIRQLEQLGDGSDARTGLRTRLRHRGEEAAELWRFKVYTAGTHVSLSNVMPILNNLGVEVIEEHPQHVRRGNDTFWIYDFGLRLPASVEDQDPEQLRTLFEDAFSASWRGDADNDSLNRLVVNSGLTWRQVTVLRAFSHYARQIGTRFSDSYMADTLVANASIARALVELFEQRHDPRGNGGAVDMSPIEQQLADVASLEEDQILRLLLSLVMATLRTNYYQRDAAGEYLPTLAMKLDAASIPEVPQPRPEFEIFVFAARVEGVHLRAGSVARGGIRWSDRREDYRTEVLGLVKAQMAKNAVIVPVGAKGGFVLRQPPTDPEELRTEVAACYRLFISSLLDLTDNLVNDEVVPPRDMVRIDGDDPYLVVAADKGTATFSDLANEIALERGYWLGDAFASGGSSGYDHKAMGITARGAWESVKRHFRELGVDIQTQPFTVAGIGDMSGDVFGNGMLLSPMIKLVAAFDHRHIFLDPNPDSASSLVERQRLFEVPRSSWDDYDRSLISAGGGVYPRSLKSIPLSEEVRAALGTTETSLTPNALISVILKAPVDLLWNGGIGTYLKASTQTDSDAGDRASDAVRINATELRCRVIGEGGNLGFTHASRIEFALRSGRVYADFIDNSAGVDTSDHEVNIKILLDRVIRDGDLTAKQRDELLKEMAPEVAAAVLQNNYDQSGTLSNAFVQAHQMIDVHGLQMHGLETSVGLNRALEGLPSEEVLAERRAANAGLTQPELATLMAYTKLYIYRSLLASDLPDDEWFRGPLHEYFPKALRARFPEHIDTHPLRRELIATTMTNHIVSRAGLSMVHRMEDETSASVAEIVRAHQVAWQTFDMSSLWAAIGELDGKVRSGTQTMMLLESRRLAERGTRWFLRNRRPPLDVAATVAMFREAAGIVAEALPELVRGPVAEELQRSTDALTMGEVPVEVARRVAGLPFMVSALDIVNVAQQTGAPIRHVAEVYFLLDEGLGIDWLRQRIVRLQRGDRWQTLARSALRDDLFREHALLTADVVAGAIGAEDAGAAVDQWMVDNGDALVRCRDLIAGIRGLSGTDLSHLSVALRELRNLQHQTAAAA
ncbi:MAG: NAD-glutamate dehydrogenase [Chloroflexi bacterium]|nr:NAD-glutamate dehydrogenase [Chloroflexota bacterium]MDA1145903.1 NAD-glutamate dehydrogenase [Chloroflexota bacterium]